MFYLSLSVLFIYFILLLFPPVSRYCLKRFKILFSRHLHSLNLSSCSMIVRPYFYRLVLLNTHIYFLYMTSFSFICHITSNTFMKTSHAWDESARKYPSDIPNTLWRSVLYAKGSPYFVFCPSRESILLVVRQNRHSLLGTPRNSSHSCLNLVAMISPIRNNMSTTSTLSRLCSGSQPADSLIIW